MTSIDSYQNRQREEASHLLVDDKTMLKYYLTSVVKVPLFWGRSLHFTCSPAKNCHATVEQHPYYDVDELAYTKCGDDSWIMAIR